MLGEALEAEFGVDLTIGPAIDEGFYYDCYMGPGRSLTDADRPRLQKRIEKARPSGPPSLRRCEQRGSRHSWDREILAARL